MIATLSAALFLALAVLKLGLCLLLIAASVHLLRLGLWSLRQPAPAPRPVAPTDTPDGDLPLVTVQLPMYNERTVAARAIAAACALDWPRLRVQVLDDSTDDTRGLIDDLVAAQRQRGIDIAVLRRPDRRGFKAGNLAHGLSQLGPDCAFVAIFDADFVPPPDFLRSLMPILLADDRLGFVQTRWAYLNEQQGLLTRVQALILDGLMLVEQAYLDAHRLPLQWNGTSGIFRTQALRAAGGWLGEAGSTSVLTEDLDVSYRALLAGYRGRHVAGLAVPSELPAAMAAFRVQQQRWVGGGAQVLRTLFGKLRSDGPRGRSLLTLLAHLARHARQPYLALSLLWLPLWVLLPLWLGPSLTAASEGPPPSLALFLASLSHGITTVASLRLGLALFLTAVVVYYGAARRQAGRSSLGAALLAPLLLPLSMGLSLSLSAALLRGLFERPEDAVFVRTPKAGPGGSADQAALSTAAPSGTPPARSSARPPLLEIGLGAAYLGLAGWLLWHGQLGSGLSLLALVAPGLLWVGLGSLRRPSL